MPETKPLSVIDGKTLLALDIEPPRFIVSRLLPVGLAILSGASKVGKSWFSLWLCQQVSKGQPIWEFETCQCSVLYLALEDTLGRLHFRLSRITEEGSEQSYFATSADNLSGALVEQLETFLREHTGTGLIVIDTLQRVRGASGEKSAYAFDYEEMNRIKALADKHGIAILLIHHVRKMPDSDPFNMVSGSTGIVGSADTMFVLEKDKRTDNKAKLHVTGRDVEDMQLLLEFDRDDVVWRFISFVSGEDEASGKLVDTVAAFLSERKTFTGTASELLEGLKAIDDALSLTPNGLTRSLKEQSLALEKRHGVALSFTRTNAARLVTLSLRDGDGENGCGVQMKLMSLASTLGCDDAAAEGVRE